MNYRISTIVLYKIVYLVGYICSLFYKAYAYYMTNRIYRITGGTIQYPYRISGKENIICGESVNIGKNSVILSTRSQFIAKGHFVSGPNLTIICGDHMPVIGKYLDTVTDTIKDSIDKDHFFDQDICIEKDVWAGANVTILKGVTIGRGCIIAAGAVVTKSMPPYHIIAGIPAKPVKMRWTTEQIIEHERALYEPIDRLKKEEIDGLSCLLKAR